MTVPATQPAPTVLTLSELRVGYRGKALLPPIACEMRAGEVWALVGRNGAGKSTLLKTLLGVQAPVGGGFRWRAGARISYVPQRDDVDATIPGRVIDMVRAGVDRGWSFTRPAWQRRFDAQVEQALRDAEIEELQNASFGEISEGQKQRALIARALVGEPEALVLDEPTSAMDPMAEAAMFCLLRELRNRLGLTVLVATHQLRLLPMLATHAIYVDSDDGMVECGVGKKVAAAASFERRYGDAYRSALRSLDDPEGPMAAHEADCHHHD